MSDLSHELLKRLAPGTGIRDGLERIRRGRTGALIVLGFDDGIEGLCDGGFELDVAFAPTRLRELCKMDGAVVLSTDGTRIRRANVQLVPDPLPTEESGTRHRSAERTALQTGVPVIAVSQSMDIITVYADGVRHVLKDSAEILSRANQALATIERYRSRLDVEAEELFGAEIAGYASAADVVGVLRLYELLRRAADSVSRDVMALGSDGHQLDVQLRELVSDASPSSRLLLHDYLVTASGVPDEGDVDAALAALAALPDPELLGARAVAQVLGYPTDPDSLAERVDPRGYRALARVPRMQYSLMDKLVARYVTLPSLLRAGSEELAEVEGVGPLWAKHIRLGLERAIAGLPT
ncbi:MAG TPA: DNA integrity scanning protein DisA [Actinomycetales bacterium]|uniref:DNA integrity scanning diadenylate cyclase DisA n=1 Tax=uncultured Corynebacterium sp. TaxID=159447 RepID=UPI0017757CAB|nr:DNA integrity scanning diadenylate cyclase DisA [uncultured Corynebacterium sp.]HHU44707.1 DNA integrity scanning protein DisA [Actinomycetales bacterium]